jgi:RNA 3'-phosphate cyclase
MSEFFENSDSLERCEQRSIDCSLLEGGGQIVRNSLSLGAIFQCGVTLAKIRHNRSNPGLSNQHLVVAQLIQELSNGTLLGATLRSVELQFDPASGVLQNPVELFKDVGSAGSVTLVLQALLPCLLFCALFRSDLFIGAAAPLPKSISLLNMVGGTNVSASPPIDHAQRILLPILAQMGLHASLTVNRRGYYPVGGGRVSVSAQPVVPSQIRALHAVRPGKIIATDGVVYGNGPHFTAEVVASFKDYFTPKLIAFFEARDLHIAASSAREKGIFQSPASTTSGVKGASGTTGAGVVADAGESLATTHAFLPSGGGGTVEEAWTPPVIEEAWWWYCRRDGGGRGGTGGGRGGGGTGRKEGGGTGTGRGRGRGGGKLNPHSVFGVQLSFTVTKTGTAAAACVLSTEGECSTNDAAGDVTLLPISVNIMCEGKAAGFVSHEQVTARLLAQLALVVDSGACVDEFTADQLIIYMCLAAVVQARRSGTGAGAGAEGGTEGGAAAGAAAVGKCFGALLCAPRVDARVEIETAAAASEPLLLEESSLHVEAAAHIAALFTGCRVTIEEQAGTRCRLISVWR